MPDKPPESSDTIAQKELIIVQMQISPLGSSTGAAFSIARDGSPVNQDCWLLNQHISHLAAQECCYSETSRHCWELAGVFDGIRSGQGGELAARIAAEEFQKICARLDDSKAPEFLDECMDSAFLRANNQILHAAPGALGTTGTVVCWNRREFRLYYLGDTRAYLLRNGELCRLTEDHTLAQLKSRAKLPVNPEDAHILTDYIGKDKRGKYLTPARSAWIPTEPGDLLLICSDGLYNSLTTDQMRVSIESDDPLEEKAENLALSARDSGNMDDITCVLVQLSS